jgi:hypothetical protein
MNSARKFEPDERIKTAQLQIEMGDWVHSLAPWQVISHMTFAWEASIWSAQRCYEKFMKQELWGVSYFYALEPNPGRDGYHVHALWCDCENKSRRVIWQTWFGRYARGSSWRTSTYDISHAPDELKQVFDACRCRLGSATNLEERIRE